MSMTSRNLRAQTMTLPSRGNSRSYSRVASGPPCPSSGITVSMGAALDEAEPRAKRGRFRVHAFSRTHAPRAVAETLAPHLFD
jgi:hypothetical protein